ncbi:MAG: hypothetical protein M3Z24_09730, partial [Chloroflexota bacterium]|nr:hypothetical protein [Chloroflexota bacterium]
MRGTISANQGFWVGVRHFFAEVIQSKGKHGKMEAMKARRKESVEGRNLNSSGVKEWRDHHPKATLREREETIDERLGQLRARMVQDAALASTQA